MSHDAGFDARLRDVHARSLDQLSPRVQAQLVQRRRAALKGETMHRGRGLLSWAGVATAGLALALVLQVGPPAVRSPTPGRVATSAPASVHAVSGSTRVDTRMAMQSDADAIAPDLSEDPEFYLWLGDARPAEAE